MGKLVITGLALILLLGIAFIAGLWITNPNEGWGAAIVAWPGQVWQQILQSQLGEQLGSGLAQKSPWITARVAGVAAYLLSFASLILGLTMSMRWLHSVLHPVATAYLHKILALLTVVFLALHLTGLALDSYLQIGLDQSLIPFGVASYRTFWTGLGTVALYAMVLVVVTAYLATKIGYKAWRTIHYLTFAIFGISLVHGLMSGTDSSSLWMQLAYLGTGLIVAILMVIRFLGNPSASQTSVADAKTLTRQ
jgi:sulfoxide reductase heme-binding subunit YedZ